MVLLALETVTRAGSLAICDDTSCASMLGDPAVTHGARLPTELLRFAADHHRTLADLNALVVVTGPGSFTGLRVGLATVQGMALTHHKTVVGIPTLDAMASGWLDRRSAHHQLLFVCLDGARGDVFYALFDANGADHFDHAQWLIAPSVDTPVGAAARVRSVLAGRACQAAGDGIERYEDVFRSAIPNVTIESPMPNLAEGAARLARRRGSKGEAPHALRPVYIRRTDAELARERASGSADLDIAEVTDAAGKAEVASLQARVFGHSWGADGLTGGEPNQEIAKLHAARQRSGKLVAYSVVWHILDELHVHSVAVDPAYQRKGIAKTLLERVLAEARAQGAVAATLEVRASNAAALALYTKLGFQTEAVRPKYYENPVEDALILWRRKL